MLSRIGPYEVVRTLGKGAMGRVFEVQHPELPGKRMALKLVGSARIEDRMLKRFEREAQLLARVRHAGLVAVHAFGRAPQGPFLVMDLVEGTSLDALVDKRGPLPFREAASIVADVSDAVAALHQSGILHRDVKPENVILRPDGKPVLLDLGVARADDSARLTETGTLVGSPLYMAPEQADGSSPANLGPGVDVYGLGALLFAILSGRPPVSHGPTLFDIVRQVVEVEPRWPSADRPDMPEALEAIVRRAMAKKPANRYPGADALAEALRGWLRESNPAGRSGPRAPARRAERPRWLAGAAAAALLLGAGLLVWALAPGEEEQVAHPHSNGAAVPSSAAPLPGRGAPATGRRPGPASLEHPGDRPGPVGACFLRGDRALTWSFPDDADPSLDASRVALWTIAAGSLDPRLERQWELPGAVGALEVDRSGVAWLLVSGRSGRQLHRLDPALDGAPRRVAMEEREGAITAFGLAPDGRRLGLAYQQESAAPRVIVLELSAEVARELVTFDLADDARVSDILFLPDGTLAVAGGGVPAHLPGQAERIGHGGVTVWPLPPDPSRERLGIVGQTNQALSLANDPDGRLWSGNSYGFVGPCDLSTGHLEPLVGQGLTAQGLPGLDPLMSAIPSHRGPVVGIAPAPGPARWLLARWTHAPRWLFTVSSQNARSEQERRVERAHELRAWRRLPGGEWTNTGAVLDWPVHIASLEASWDGELLLVGTRGKAVLCRAAEVREGFRTWRELTGE